jgi:ribosomal protein S18 acetylase RimI-like enzyme
MDSIHPVGIAERADIRLRPLTPADAPAAAALIRAAFAAQPRPVDPPPSALRETAESVAAQIATEGGMAAGAAGTLAGVILWAAKDGGLYLARLAIAPFHRRRGIARALVAAGEAEARRRGLPRLHLGARLALDGNRALFASCGFREVALHAHPGYAAPTWVEMEKDLDAQG